jgi:uncharacterized membrane protein (UPF0127 family)
MVWRVSFWNFSFIVLGSFLVTTARPAMAQPKVSATSAQSQVIFKQAKLKIGNLQIKVELAETDEQKERGLMYRTKLNPNTGMLFIFEDEQVRSFWMKNTFLDLSIGYFDKNKKLIDVHEMVGVRSVMETPKTYQSSGPAKYALEMPKEWFSTNKIKVGTAFSLVP